MLDCSSQFNYQEQFAVIIDEKFLKRVDKQHLQLEIWQRVTDGNDGSGNNNKTDAVKPFGIVRLPLHQFFIAYRDAAIANHLCKGKLPVISIDAWTSIGNCQTGGATVGALKCLLAIGSEEQISNLKMQRNFASHTTPTETLAIDTSLFSKWLDQGSSSSSSIKTCQPQLKNTNDLLDMLQKALITSQPAGTAAPVPQADFLKSSALAAGPQTSAMNPMLNEKLLQFQFVLDIKGATGLPLNPNPPAKGKKQAKRNAHTPKRFPPNEAPSTYVTFQAHEGYGKVYKSHEGVVYATGIAEKSAQPQWKQRFHVVTDLDYLTNPQKNFILKVWKKATTPAGFDQRGLQPAPMEDAIIGFVALDLSVFQRGLHICGLFNIIDFNGRVNGQLEIGCQPLQQNLRQIIQPDRKVEALAITNTADAATPTTSALAMDAVIDQFENSLDLSHLNLGQAIKRKFTELEEISQRLRTRLGDVTGESLAPQFDFGSLDDWLTLDANDDDADLDEFERDINIAPHHIPPQSTQDEEANKMISRSANFKFGDDDSGRPKE